MLQKLAEIDKNALIGISEISRKFIGSESKAHQTRLNSGGGPQKCSRPVSMIAQHQQKMARIDIWDPPYHQ